jgi:hypothetical protein
MSHRSFGLIVSLALIACGDVRARPEPFDPATEIDLEAEVLAPRSSDTVRGGDSLRVRVRGFERGNRLTGLGYVARRLNGQTLDSAAVHFSERADSTHQFAFRLPPTLASNTQVDVVGIAFGPSANVAVSAAQSVIVIACTPGTAICQ